MESDCSQSLTKSEKELSGQLVSCDPQNLLVHPSYARRGLAVPADKLSALRARRELAFIEPLTITRDRIIIDGYARWELAKELKRPILHCIEYDLSETEALEWLLQRHRRSAGLNDYTRIMLAWDLEPVLVEKARANRPLGGREKGWSNLTRAERIHVRAEIAKVAAVSTGNVTKVKQLNETCVPELIAAVYGDEVSIHWAWKLRNESPEDQLDALGCLRFEKGLLKDVRKLAATRQRAHSAAPQDTNELVIKRFSSKWHFLRYAARYLRRPPIAEHRIISITSQHVEYWANDLKLKAWVRITVSVEEFLELLIQHVPDHYVHGIRYFGLASPAGRHLFSSALYVLLGQEQRPRPKRLSFEAMSQRYFGSNPLLDSHGHRMRRVGRQAPASVSAA